jgi:hypothetical protein
MLKSQIFKLGPSRVGFHEGSLPFGLNSWEKFEHNKCEATGSQRLSENIVSPYFLYNMFDRPTCKRRNVFLFT